jgi:phosphoserine phosphatase
MAQPKRDQRELSPQRKELENLEKKASGFLQRRNELNDQGRTLRGERDLLNGKKAELFNRMNQIRDEREKFNAILREHKEARNAYQAQAKELLGRRRNQAKDKKEASSAPLRARELQHAIREMEYKQQTQVLKSKEEEKLVKEIRLKRAELAKIEPDLKKAARVKVDLSDTEKAIDVLFAKADEEHQLVVAAYKSAQEQHEKYVEVVKEVGRVIAEANAKHEEFIELRKKADEQHQKAMELREKILDIKGEERAQRQEARQIIKEQSRSVRQAVANPEGLEKAANDALEQLKKGGKISFG